MWQQLANSNRFWGTRTHTHTHTMGKTHALATLRHPGARGGLFGAPLDAQQAGIQAGMAKMEKGAARCYVSGPGLLLLRGRQAGRGEEGENRNTQKRGRGVQR